MRTGLPERIRFRRSRLEASAFDASRWPSASDRRRRASRSSPSIEVMPPPRTRGIKVRENLSSRPLISCDRSPAKPLVASLWIYITHLPFAVFIPVLFHNWSLDADLKI